MVEQDLENTPMAGVSAEGEHMGFHAPPFLVLASTLHHEQPHEKLYLIYNSWQDQKKSNHLREKAQAQRWCKKTEFESWMELPLQKAPQYFKLSYQQP